MFWGVAWQGRRTSSCRGLAALRGPSFRMHAGSPADMRQDEGIPIPFGASVRPCISPEPASPTRCPESLALHDTQPVHSHACTDRQPLSLFCIRCRRSRSLVLLGSHAGGSRQIHRAGQSGGISLSLTSFWVLYERVLRGVGEFEGARGSFLAQGKVPLAPSILSSSHPLTFVVPSLS